MSSQDWKDALGALLPDDYEPEPQQVETPRPRKLPRLTVTLDRKRAGKTATIISGFDPDDEAIQDVAAAMKRKLATGGSVRDGEILVQGDRVESVKAWLKTAGYKC